MKKGGVGGANTKTGLAFELKTDLPNFISKQSGYEVVENDFDIKLVKRTGEVRKIKRSSTARWIVNFEGEKVAEIFQKHGLYRYFDEVSLNYKAIISKKLLPDDSIFVMDNNVIGVFLVADQFTIAGLGKDVATNVGIDHRKVVLLGTGMIAAVIGIITVVIGNLPFLGLIIPNIVSLLRGDNLRSNLPWVCLTGAAMVTACDIVGRPL